MKYESPKINDKPYYVPIVVKNKDYLIGYLRGIYFIKDIVTDALKKSGFGVDFKGMDLGLDSLRFNDFINDGIRISDLTQEEFKKYIRDKIEKQVSRFQNAHPENVKDDDSLLDIECSCGFGFYSFNTPDEIPDDGFYCVECGKKLIDFTNHSDEDFEYDGIVRSEEHG